MQEALWMAHLLNGKLLLPDKKGMLAYTKGWMDKQDKLKTDEDLIRFQDAHCLELEKDCDAPNVTVVDEFLQWEKDRHDNLITHRDKCFTSVFTKQKAVKPHKPWLESKTPHDFMGEKLAKDIKIDDWLEEVGGGYFYDAVETIKDKVNSDDPIKDIFNI
eukprot:UN29811